MDDAPKIKRERLILAEDPEDLDLLARWMYAHAFGTEWIPLDEADEVTIKRLTVDVMGKVRTIGARVNGRRR